MTHRLRSQASEAKRHRRTHIWTSQKAPPVQSCSASPSNAQHQAGHRDQQQQEGASCRQSCSPGAAGAGPGAPPSHAGAAGVKELLAPALHVSFFRFWRLLHADGSLSGSTPTSLPQGAPRDGETRGLSSTDGAAVPAIARRAAVCVASAVRSPDTSGGRAVAPGSYVSFPGRQPVASGFLQRSEAGTCPILSSRSR